MEEMEFEIRPKSAFSFGWKELIEYRELLYFFIWRDIKIKYKQTFLGIGWVVFQPLLLTLVFTFILGSRFGNELGSLNYPVFVLSGFMCWNIFSGALSNAGNSMVSNANIIKKIYFPRIIIPLSAVAGSFFDFAVASIIYFVVLIYYATPVDAIALLNIPLALFLVFIAALGTGSLIAALNVKYRDFRYVLPFMIQSMMFVSPVFYPLCRDCGIASCLLALNPMYAALELFRTHLDGYTLQPVLIGISIAMNLVLLLIGLLVFRKTENYFADLA